MVPSSALADRQHTPMILIEKYKCTRPPHSQCENPKKSVTNYLVFLFLFIQLHSISQKQYHRYTGKEFGVEMIKSGNGHPAQYAPYLGLNSAAHHVLFQLLADARHTELCGGRIYYSRNLSAQTRAVQRNAFSPRFPEPLQLNWFSYFQYNHQTLLSPALIDSELRMSSENRAMWKDVRYNTTEFGSGIEFRLNFNHHFSWRVNIAAAVYKNRNYETGLGHEQSRVCIMYGTALGYSWL